MDKLSQAGGPQTDRLAPMGVVMMGVAGCGKSVVGKALAQALGFTFIEGDALQPPENVARMARGEPLTDALREGWLKTVGAHISGATRRGEGAVAACSALKRSYRDQLRAADPSLAFIHLVISPETARKRVGSRRGHFMPASLVDSQFAALEPPGPDEHALAIGSEIAISEIVAVAKAFLAARQGSALKQPAK